MFVLFIFFFKQKTAYEMRISDWSSDVCSSDLDRPVIEHRAGADDRCVARGRAVDHRAFRPHPGDLDLDGQRVAGAVRRRADRSEEHTSELQSLMRISYAVFCLKKKKKHKVSTVKTHDK